MLPSTSIQSPLAQNNHNGGYKPQWITSAKAGIATLPMNKFVTQMAEANLPTLDANRKLPVQASHGLACACGIQFTGLKLPTRVVPIL